MATLLEHVNVRLATSGSEGPHSPVLSLALHRWYSVVESFCSTMPPAWAFRERERERERENAE